jgi:hypothetical protein
MSWGKQEEREDPLDFSGIWSLAQALSLHKEKGQESNLLSWGEAPTVKAKPNQWLMVQLSHG